MPSVHTAPHTGQTHRGTSAACAEYPCAPHRDALAILREDDPRTPAEQAAIDAVNARRWVPWHATDEFAAVVLLLSRAGLLRDLADEQRALQTASAMARISERTRIADRRAIAAFTELAALAAGRLDDGAEPAEVAAQLRDLAGRITERREHQSSPAAPGASSQEAATV